MLRAEGLSAGGAFVLRVARTVLERPGLDGGASAVGIPRGYRNFCKVRN